jgi:hypothetical protein
MAGAEAVFSQSYQEARTKFIEAAAAAGLPVQSHVHPLRGRDGEELAMDVVREGPADARELLILSSGCHGVEGYCGSGIQVGSLRAQGWHDFVRSKGVAILYVHALNPYGFSHWKRTTHENIDLNRNFHDFSKPLPENPGYRELHPLLVPREWPPSGSNQVAIGNYIATRGMQALQAAITRGQHEFPDGLFFGGTKPSWSNDTLRQVLREHGRAASRMAWIDFHTGLGPSGVGERIFAAPNDDATLARAKAWWDGGGATPVTSMYDGSSTSAYLTGLMWTSACEECPQAEFTGMALEYGTLPMLETLESLRADQWLHVHPEAPAQQAAAIKQQVRDAFYVDTAEWKLQVLQQARQAVHQAVEGLAS